MSEREIIGYKLVKPYAIPARRILKCEPMYDYAGLGLITAKGDIEALQQAGVLDLWFEPVYEQKPIPKDSDADNFRKMVEGKQHHTLEFGCNKFTFRFIDEKTNIHFNSDGSFSHIYSYNQ
jgi:hypothetical protein